MPRRFNIETLERRQMYAAQPFMDYTDDVAVSVAAGDVNGDGAADVVRAVNSIKSPRDVATGQAAGLVGDFNNDGRDDVAEFFPGAVYATRSGGEIIPSEYFSLNFQTIDVEFKANELNGDDLVGWNASAAGFMSHTRPHADGVLIGMLLPYMEQDNIYNVGDSLGVDVWEHANLQGGPQTNGIIAVLIGLVQPETEGNSDTSALERKPAANGIIAVLIGLMQDVTDGTSNTMMLAVDPSDASGSTMSSAILASDEFFSRFANTTFDDEAVAVRMGKVSQITHDPEFENWARVSRFDRGYLPPVGNSILHEENEFSFPRMIRGR
jgi:hypothetical protein